MRVHSSPSVSQSVMSFMLSGDLESLVESARFLLLLSNLNQQRNLYDERHGYLSKAKEVQDRCVPSSSFSHELLNSLSAE